MSKFKNILKSPFFIVPVVSLLVSGALISAFVITDKDNKVEYKTEQTSSSTSTLFNEFSTYKQQVQSALANDDYTKIDSYTDNVSKDLKQDTDFKMFVEDLNVLKETKKGIDDKSITDYDGTLAKLEMHSNTDAILKRKAEDYTRTVKDLRTYNTYYSSQEASQSEPATEATQSEQPAEVANSQTETATTQNAEDPYNLVGTYVHGNNGDYRVVEYIKGYYVVATHIPTNYGGKSVYSIYDPKNQILDEKNCTDSLTQVENYLGKW